MLEENPLSRKCVARAWRLSSAGLYVVLFGLYILMIGCQEAPIHELQAARQAVGNARREGALVFAPDLYSLAESELTIAEEEFHEQSGKIFWARDYSMATRLMLLAQTDAREALSLAQEEKQKFSMSEKAPYGFFPTTATVRGSVRPTGSTSSETTGEADRPQVP